MKLLGIIGIGLLLAVAIVAAYDGYGTHHEEMESIMESGSFADLQAYRAQVGYDVMPWVESAEDFSVWQARHEQMERFHEENGYGMMRGNAGEDTCPFAEEGGCPYAEQREARGGFGGRGAHGAGCPMLQ